MGPNAIRISDRVEKVELDFASDESLKESLGFARLYTIHTAKTNEMSQRLGFHIGGYCDDRGRGGPALAASLVGYECLPSDVVLFKMDEKYNPLPLNEEELNSLFVFLKTGKVISPEAKLQIQEFFKEQNIDLALPDFPLPMESIRFAQLPNLIAIIYDESSIQGQAAHDEYAKIQNTYYSLVKEKTEESGFFEIRIAKDGSYFLRIQRYNNLYYLYIQAIKTPGEEPKIPSTFGLNPFYIDEEEEPEEEKPHYFLEFEVDSDWPDSKDHFHYSSTDVFLDVNEEKRVSPNEEVPYFNDFVHFKELDPENETLKIVIDQKIKQEEFVLKLDEPLSIDFDYVDNVPTSHRVGKAKLTLRKAKVVSDSLLGKLVFRFKEKKDGKLLTEDEQSIEEPTSKIDCDLPLELADGDVYGVFLIDKANGYCILYHFPQEDNGDKTAFHLLKLGKEFVRRETVLKKGSLITMTLTINYFGL